MDTSAWVSSLSSGLLPKFQLLVAIIAITNSVQVYLTTKYSARVYVGTPTAAGSISKSLASRKATASPAPVHSTRSRTPSKPLASADEPEDEPSASAGPSPNTAVTRARPAKNTSPVTPFAARMFGNWTLLSGIIRLYCALNVSDPLVYQLTVWTYVIVIAHYSIETFVFGTTGPAAGRAIVGPVIIGPTSLVWMLMQWGYYVK